MKLPNILKNNKGMAIEMAIVTFIVVFALCTILTLFTVKSKNYVFFTNNRIKEKVYIDSIADSYMSHLNYQLLIQIVLNLYQKKIKQSLGLKQKIHL